MELIAFGISIGIVFIIIVDMLISHSKNKKKPKEVYGKSWAISYYATGPKENKQIGLLFIQADNIEMAQAKACIEVSMRNPGMIVRNVIAAEAGISIKKDLPQNPPWKDLVENSSSHDKKIS